MAKRRQRRTGKEKGGGMRSRKRSGVRKTSKNKVARKVARPPPKPPLPQHPRKRIARRATDITPRPAPRRRAKAADSIYDRDLDRNPANFQPLTPLWFLERAALVFPDHPAIVHGTRTFTYADFYARS